MLSTLGALTTRVRASTALRLTRRRQTTRDRCSTVRNQTSLRREPGEPVKATYN